MRLFTAPDLIPPTARNGLFLAGGISNCPDWQADIIERLSSLPVTVYNPRRELYPTESDAAEQQIRWEYEALNMSSVVSFWFPSETLCPITLFELGRFSHQTETELFVGTHPDYARRFDVVTQLKLARPEVTVVDSLDALTIQLQERFSGAASK